MTQNGRNELRHILTQTLTMFLRVAEDQNRDKAVAVKDLAGLVQPFLASPAIAMMIGEQYGRLLSQVDKGTNLTITGETGNYYAVLMIDRSVGFIEKARVNLLDYEVTSSQTLPSGAPAGQLGQALIQTAVQFMGVPYVYGGVTTNGIDCSAFVRAVYEANGVSLPRTAAEQASVGMPVSTTDVTTWLPGDRIYFQCHHDYIDHAGMYIGNGYFIHSSIGNHGVAVTRIDSPYYWSHIVTVRRSAALMSDASSAGTPAQDTESSQQ